MSESGKNDSGNQFQLMADVDFNVWRTLKDTPKLLGPQFLINLEHLAPAHFPLRLVYEIQVLINPPQLINHQSKYHYTVNALSVR